MQQQLQLLLRKMAQLEKDKQRLQTELETLRTEHNRVQQQLEIAQMQQHLLKAAQQPLNEEEKKEMERTLRQYIGYIDQCIALLSR
ncbi:MAG: hypothetical protein ACK4E8_11260 [Lacibacter sp.]